MIIKQRQIGKIIGFNNAQIIVELDNDCNSNYKALMGSTHKVLSLNSYVSIPLLCETLIGTVQKITIEPEKSPNDGNLYLSKARRLIEIHIIGRICKNADGQAIFEEGINIYPGLDNPVCYISDEELEIIFDNPDERTDVRIGVNVQHNQPVYLNIDKFLGMHAAVLGNTGTGKSHTVTAILRAILQKTTEKTEQSPATIIVFDTNDEYKKAFNEIPNCTVTYFSNDINSQETNVNKFFIPYWFLNTQEFYDLFDAALKSQQPFLNSVLSISKLVEIKNISDSIKLEKYYKKNFIDCLDSLFNKYLLLGGSSSEKGGSIRDWKNKIELTRHIRSIIQILQLNISDEELICDFYKEHKPEDQWLIDHIKLTKVIEKFKQLEIYKEVMNLEAEQYFEESIANYPCYFNWKKLLNDFWELRLCLSEDPKLRDYVSTLRWRINTLLSDKDFQELLLFNNKSENRINLFEFIINRLLGYDNCFGLDEYRKESQVIIIDTSFMTPKGLSIITSVIARLILNLQKRIRNTNKKLLTPILLILEEAHNYIPNKDDGKEEAVLMASKLTFEKIAKEGRKYGVGLIVSSQRPSELSKTVISQCNSFIIHRLQNPVDLDMIRKSIPYLSKEIFDQLTSLQRQTALVFGQGFKMPTITKINTLNKDHRPDSNDIEFSKYWAGINEQNEEFDHLEYCSLIKSISDSLEMKSNSSLENEEETLFLKEAEDKIEEGLDSEKNIE